MGEVEKEEDCHRRYCSALDIRFIAWDVCFVVVCYHNCKALHYAICMDRCMSRTCIMCPRVQPEWYRNAYTLGSNR